jgi:hypothetical protein
MLLARGLGLKDTKDAFTYRQIMHKVISDQVKFTAINIEIAF